MSAPRAHDGAAPEHPVVTRMREHRAADLQLRMADAITRSAGSMRFVWLHAVAFAVWMLVVEAPRRGAPAGGRRSAEVNRSLRRSRLRPGQPREQVLGQLVGPESWAGAEA